MATVKVNIVDPCIAICASPMVPGDFPGKRDQMRAESLDHEGATRIYEALSVMQDDTFSGVERGFVARFEFGSRV